MGQVAFEWHKTLSRNMKKQLLVSLRHIVLTAFFVRMLFFFFPDVYLVRGAWHGPETHGETRPAKDNPVRVLLACFF